MLAKFLDIILAAHKAGVSGGALRAHLLLQGMDEEEISLILDIIALQNKNNAQRNK